MKIKKHLKTAAAFSSCAVILSLVGCATTDSTTNPTGSIGANGNRFPSKYIATDGRTIEIGSRSAADGGWNYRDPHLDKCWIASDFNFSGYDTLYIAPTLSTAKLHNPEEESPHQLAKENLPIELNQMLNARNIFANVVFREADIKPGDHVLKLENTITDYAKGGGAARYFVGLYGGGQPVLRVSGKMTDGGKTVFSFEVRRSGTSAGARMVGAFKSDVDIQTEDIRSMVLDLTDFMAAVAGKYQPAN